MKRLVLLSAIAISGLIHNTAKAQFSVHVGVNLFPHRVLVAPRVDVDAPVYTDVNYDDQDDYYYLPDVNAYYNVNEQCYYYFDGNNWIAADYLPGEYREFDWRAARRYEIHASRPYLHNDVYFNRYRGNVDVAYNRDRFKDGFDNRDNHYANRGPQHFDNTGYGQQFDNRRGEEYHEDHNPAFDHNNNGGWGNHQAQQSQGRNQGWKNDQQPAQNQNHGWGNDGGHQGNQQPTQNQNRGNNGFQPNQTGNHNNGNHGDQQQRFAQNNPMRGGHNFGARF
jgi:hypothetical protein